MNENYSLVHDLNYNIDSYINRVRSEISPNKKLVS